MKTDSERFTAQDITGTQSFSHRDTSGQPLKAWRHRLTYCSIFAAVPAVLASQVQATSSPKSKEPPAITKDGKTVRHRLNTGPRNPALLKRQSEFLLPHQQSSFGTLTNFAGVDDCPGGAVPGGTYTAAAPLVFTGDTTSANGTVNSLASFYYYFYPDYNAFGPDHVYSFTITSYGPNPRIEVSTTSGTYRPLIYLLPSGSCPAGTGNRAAPPWAFSDSRWFGGNTASIGLGYLPLNVPFYLFVDSAFNDNAGAGPYEIRMQDVTIAAAAGCSYANPIDCSDFFIGQQYRDFLGREPEPSCPPNQCGLDFYLPILQGCGTHAECLGYTRGALSANFFRSPEFQQKGAYVANLYNITLGQRAKTVAELSDPLKVERPHYGEFIADLTTLTAPTEAETNLKKDQLAAAFLQRPEILQILPGSLTNQQFVQKLENIAGVTLANEAALIGNLNNGVTRGSVLRAVAESSEVSGKFYIQNFVAMEYFGYLRRDPEDCHLSSDPANCGYIFHNSRFNTPGADPDLIENIIVRGFIESPEYRGRFGP